MKLGAVMIEPFENEMRIFSKPHFRQFSCLTRLLLAPALGLLEKPSVQRLICTADH